MRNWSERLHKVLAIYPSGVGWPADWLAGLPWPSPAGGEGALEASPVPFTGPEPYPECLHTYASHQPQISLPSAQLKQHAVTQRQTQQTHCSAPPLPSALPSPSPTHIHMFTREKNTRTQSGTQVEKRCFEPYSYACEYDCSPWLWVGRDPTLSPWCQHHGGGRHPPL